MVFFLLRAWTFFSVPVIFMGAGKGICTESTALAAALSRKRRQELFFGHYYLKNRRL